MEGHANEYARVGDSGGVIAFRFCPTCGTTISYTIDQMPGTVAIPVGNFADPKFPAPVFSVYEARKHSWVSLPEGIEHMD